tara:strand:+ start:725 stop:2701 length:1977 start_codon:yes stop_codon:yes gene_type:complete
VKKDDIGGGVASVAGHYTFGDKMKQIFLHCCGILAIFAFTVLVRFPALANADYFLDHDTSFMAAAILELMNGGAIFFNYEEVNYHGIVGGLTAIPFMQFLGTGALAFNLPGSLYYALYVWSSFLLTRKIAAYHVPFHQTNRAAFFVVLLMLFPPPLILNITVRNYTHTEIAFIGNIIFFLFICARTEGRNSVGSVFFLGAVMGLAIYWYTYSVLHVFTVLILLMLTHERWKSLRSFISFRDFLGLFKNLATKRYVLARVLDVIIVCFCVGIIFSYVFGGFGLDIAGYSIFQINKLHKPVSQLVILLVVRLMVRRDDATSIWESVNRWIRSLKPETRRIAGFGMLGFLIGLTPRIIPIAMGDIKRGGQGFDVDFMPVKLVAHFWSLVTESLPEALGIRQPLLEWFAVGFSRPIPVITGFLSLVVLGMMLWSVISLVASRKEDLIRILKFTPISFHPILILVIFVTLLLASVVVTQHGPVTRYLYPMFGILAIGVAVTLDKFRRISQVGFAVLIVAWIGFYMMTTYKMFKENKVISGASVVRLPKNPLFSAIEFLKSKNIRTVYTSRYFSTSLTFLSRGEVIGTEYSKTARGKKQQARSAKETRFAVLLHENFKADLMTIQQYLSENEIDYQIGLIGPHRVFWDFKGEGKVVDGLRSIID